MNPKKLQVVFLMANNSSVPYFNLFAERSNLDDTYEFSFVCLHPTKPKMIEDMKGYNCKCYWVKFDSKNRKSEMIKATWKLFKLFRKIKPHVINSHLFDDSLPALLAARLAE